MFSENKNTHEDLNKHIVVFSFKHIVPSVLLILFKLNKKRFKKLVKLFHLKKK